MGCIGRSIAVATDPDYDKQLLEAFGGGIAGNRQDTQRGGPGLGESGQPGAEDIEVRTRARERLRKQRWMIGGRHGAREHASEIREQGCGGGILCRRGRREHECQKTCKRPAYRDAPAPATHRRRGDLQAASQTSPRWSINVPALP